MFYLFNRCILLDPNTRLVPLFPGHSQTVFFSFLDRDTRGIEGGICELWDIIE